MNLIIDAKVLAQALDLVCSSVEHNKTLAAELRSIHLSVAEDKITITGSDMTVRARAEITSGFTVTTPGVVLLSGERLLHMAKSSKGQEIKISINKSEQIVVKRSGSEWTSFPIDPIRFPKGPVEPTEYFGIKNEDLCFLLTQVAFACNENKTFGKVTDSVCIDIENGVFVSVGTDGSRIAVARVEGQFSSSDVFPITIPSRAIKSILVAARGVEKTSDVMIGKSDNQTFFKFENFLTSCVQFAEKYPNWRVVLPTLEKCLRIDFSESDPLQIAISDMSIIQETSVGGSNAVKFEISNGGKNLKIQKKGSNGTIKAEVPCTASEKPIIFFVDPKQLLDYLNSLSNTQLSLFYTEKAPLYFQSSDGQKKMEYLQAQSIVVDAA